MPALGYGTGDVTLYFENGLLIDFYFEILRYYKK